MPLIRRIIAIVFFIEVTDTVMARDTLMQVYIHLSIIEKGLRKKRISRHYFKDFSESEENDAPQIVSAEKLNYFKQLLKSETIGHKTQLKKMFLSGLARLMALR